MTPGLLVSAPDHYKGQAVAHECARVVVVVSSSAGMAMGAAVVENRRWIRGPGPPASWSPADTRGMFTLLVGRVRDFISETYREEVMLRRGNDGDILHQVQN